MKNYRDADFVVRGPNCTAGPRPTKGPANFALGSASSQLQEVLVTNLPRSFNSGERESREGGREGERDEREDRQGRDRKGQVFQL